MVTAGYKLFTPLALDVGLTLKNRVVMAPMARSRSDTVTRTPTELNALYYAQRAGAGLIISEATAVSDQGYGWYGSPALYSEVHVAGWKNVTDRVHAKGGKIFNQLYHVGRQGHSSFNAKHELVSASAIAVPGDGLTKTVSGEAVPFEVPHSLRTDEITEVVETFRRAAELAKAAGFDGIEIHGANGYLIDQFLQSVTNTRTDQYGGSIQNRTRFLLEVVDAVTTVWPASRVGVRLSPNGGFGGMGSPDNAEQFVYAMEQLGRRGLGYLAILDGFGFGHHSYQLLTAFDAKKYFKGLVLANNSYTRDTAEGAVRSGAADFVAFGRLHISTPDLAERFEQDVPLNPDASYDAFWNAAKGASGYTDFPFHSGSSDGSSSIVA